MPHRGRVENPVRVLKELAGLDLHLVHEPAAEHRPAHQPAERGFPLVAVRGLELALLGEQGGARPVAVREVGERELNAHEPPARVPLLVQPVGEDEPL